MNYRVSKLMLAILTSGLVLSGISSAQALSMKECSAKYKAAQSAGTLNGMKWNDFRKAECAANAAVTSQDAVAKPADNTPGSDAPAKAAGVVPAAVEKAPAAPAEAGSVVYPTAVSDKYASEKAGKARMLTCRDQYSANKSTNGNGGLKWIQKGGGYYSECNKRLKSE